MLLSIFLVPLAVPDALHLIVKPIILQKKAKRVGTGRALGLTNRQRQEWINAVMARL